jgi:hypothetical protein
VLRAVVHERGEGHDVRCYPTRQHLHTGLVMLASSKEVSLAGLVSSKVTMAGVDPIASICIQV